MADLTIAQISAKLPAGDSVKTWWDAAAALPADTTLNEFLAKTLKAAHEAQVTENEGLVSPNLIDGYPEPVNGAVALDTATGVMAFRSTLSVTTLVPVSLDDSVSPLA